MVTKIKKLGCGSYADVYHVKINGKDYALKENFSNEVDFCNCLREIHSMKKINKHPYIMTLEDTIIEYKKEKNYINFLYELADCELKANKISISDAGKIIVELMLAVEFIHSRNIIHRDIKPYNVLMFGSDVKLTDFGISCDANLNYFKDPAFTPGFRPPEVCLRENYDFKADIWSLGALIYYIVYGEYYIDKFEDNNEKLLSEIKQKEHDFLINRKRPSTQRVHSISKILNLDIIDKMLRNMLHSDKNERLTITDIFFDKKFDGFFANYRYLIDKTREQYRPYMCSLNYPIKIVVDKLRCKFINEMVCIVDDIKMSKNENYNVKFACITIFDRCRDKINLTKKLFRRTIVYIVLKFCIDDLFFDYKDVIGKYPKNTVAEAEKTIILDALNGVIFTENIYTLTNRYFNESLSKIEMLYKFFTLTGFNGKMFDYFSTAIKISALNARKQNKILYCNKI